MDAGDTHALGYRQVDGDPNVPVLLGTMDATGQWEATRRLREWERHGLQLQPGQRLLDVGCGLGDAALALAADLGVGGEVVGIDRSAAMIGAARARAVSLPLACAARFEVGDAGALAEPAGAFDAVRSERTLQWLTDPAVAVAELARVLRVGGVLSLLDTDWSSFALDVGDPDLSVRVRDAMRDERGRASNVGRRLGALAEAAGLEVAATTSATQEWHEWDPDASPAPDGCFSMASLADDLVDRGQLEAGDRDGFVATVHAAARKGRFSMALTMYGVLSRRPR